MVMGIRNLILLYKEDHSKIFFLYLAWSHGDGKFINETNINKSMQESEIVGLLDKVKLNHEFYVLIMIRTFANLNPNKV